MVTRRIILRDGLAILLSTVGAQHDCSSKISRSSRPYGCILSQEQSEHYLNENTDTRMYVSGNEPMIPRSGNRNFDLALAKTLAKISKALEVLPGFAYYDDYDALNAYATPNVRLKNADGTVLFGKRLLTKLLAQKENPEVAVSAVCAHEFGHILQFKHGLDRIVGEQQETIKRVELQADFFAGYFAGLRKLERPNFPAAVFAMTQHYFGDNMTSDPGHHGTPQERGEAISAGFDVAYRERRSLPEAIRISVAYVRAR